LIDYQKKELRRREIITYIRKNASSPSSQPNNPLPLAEKVAPSPPLSICEFLPMPTPTDENQLHIDVASMFGKLNMIVLVIDICKIPSI
jgi:hypothetical protein